MKRNLFAQHFDFWNENHFVQGGLLSDTLVTFNSRYVNSRFLGFRPQIFWKNKNVKISYPFFVSQKNYVSQFLQNNRSGISLLVCIGLKLNFIWPSFTVKQQIMEQRSKPMEKRKCHSEMVSIMSTLYANLLIVVGIAVPVTASVTERVPPVMNQVTRSSNFRV